MELNLQAVGGFIQACRKELNLTQSELSERLNVTPQAVSKWERGESLPDVAILPELAGILRCSVDAILMGGKGGIGYRRHVTMAQMREALGCLERMGTLLGRDHFMYQCIINALNTQMNTTIELAFSDPHIFEVFALEMALGCARDGDYVDPRDIMAHTKESRARDGALQCLREMGIR